MVLEEQWHWKSRRGIRKTADERTARALYPKCIIKGTTYELTAQARKIRGRRRALPETAANYAAERRSNHPPCGVSHGEPEEENFSNGRDLTAAAPAIKKPAPT